MMSLKVQKFLIHVYLIIISIKSIFCFIKLLMLGFRFPLGAFVATSNMFKLPLCNREKTIFKTSSILFYLFVVHVNLRISYYVNIPRQIRMLLAWQISWMRLEAKRGARSRMSRVQTMIGVSLKTPFMQAFNGAFGYTWYIIISWYKTYSCKWKILFKI